MNRQFLAFFLFRAVILSALALALAVTDAGWEIGLVLALGAWLLLVAALSAGRFRIGGSLSPRLKRFGAVGDAMLAVSSVAFVESLSLFGWTLVVAGCTAWYIAGRPGLRNGRIDQDSIQESSRYEQPTLADDGNQIPFHLDHKKLKLFRRSTIVMWVVGIVLILLRMPWYSVVILVAVALAFDAYVWRDFLRGLLRRH